MNKDKALRKEYDKILNEKRKIKRQQGKDQKMTPILPYNLTLKHTQPELVSLNYILYVCIQLGYYERDWRKANLIKTALREKIQRMIEKGTIVVTEKY